MNENGFFDKINKLIKKIEDNEIKKENNFLLSMQDVIKCKNKWSVFVKLYRSQKYDSPNIGFVTSPRVYDYILENAKKKQGNLILIAGFFMKIEKNESLEGFQFLPLPRAIKMNDFSFS